jgi:hypothetical protein
MDQDREKRRTRPVPQPVRTKHPTWYFLFGFAMIAVAELTPYLYGGVRWIFEEMPAFANTRGPAALQVIAALGVYFGIAGFLSHWGRMIWDPRYRRHIAPPFRIANIACTAILVLACWLLGYHRSVGNQVKRVAELIRKLDGEVSPPNLPPPQRRDSVKP